MEIFFKIKFDRFFSVSKIPRATPGTSAIFLYFSGNKLTATSCSCACHQLTPNIL